MQRPSAMAVPVTADRDHAAILTIGGLRAAPVTRPLQRLIQFALDHGMDEAAHALAHLRFNRIKPVVEKIHSRSADRLRELRLRDRALHGVVSCPTTSGDSRLITP